MSEWSSEWGSGGTREVTALVGEGVAAPRSPDSNLGRERQTDRAAEREGRREVYGEREGEGEGEGERADKRISPMTFHFDSCQFFS